MLSDICKYEPDAVIDSDTPGTDGFEVARPLREKHLAVEIIFLTMHNSKAIFNPALDLRVRGYVLKDDESTCHPNPFCIASCKREFCRHDKRRQSL